MSYAEQESIIRCPDIQIQNARCSHDINKEISKEISKETPKETTFNAELDQGDFPEGGKGWLVIAGCICCSLISFGLVNGYGAFQTFYETQLFPTVQSSRLSIIGGCQPTVMYFFTPLWIPLINATGLRFMLTMASCFIITSMFGLSSIHQGQLWKSYLFHAVMFPFGASVFFCVLMFMPMEWFKKRRATAVGIAMGGTSIGGIVWPILIKNLVPKIGFNWTVRVIGFMFIPLAIGAVVLTPQRLEDKFVSKPNTMSNSTYSRDKLKQLPTTYRLLFQGWIIQATDAQYMTMLFANLIGMFASYPAIFYVDLFGTLLAPDTAASRYLIVIYNIFGFPGRVIPGIMGDRIGRLNTLLIVTVLCSISLLALWLPITEYKNMTAFVITAATFGFSVSPIYSLFPAAFAQVFGTRDSEARLGFYFFTSTPGPILGCLIAGSFIPLDKTSKDDQIKAYVGLVSFCGGMIVACGLVVLLVRLWINKKILVFV
ncbi:Riboflavin transporter MCH5 [Cyberlindnera fabianii]|uniref:Riboflavin transporter MCH5 n=1 Tax=Cyberlindnera fabianii TaxID=36022 RepID=A0A1V2KZT4_CYBFA|nr:Riboflavin transporter MCH5 [Cyberlindnera fabianii]